MRLLHVVGARPNFMKIAPLIREARRFPDLENLLVHTGQHYDAAMSDVFFRELGIPEPDLDLGVGSASHAQQTAAVMSAFEPVVLDWKPDLIIVVGDVNSTMACALVGAKLLAPVAHVEAGLRSFDRTMPEEVNRVVTDAVAEFCFTTSADANEHLQHEGVSAEKVFLVGNVMIDTLLAQRERARSRDARARYGVAADRYALLTLHRPSNVDEDDRFAPIVRALETIARDMPILFPVHPRTRPVLDRSAAVARLVAQDRLRLLDPLGYLDFLGLMSEAAIVLGDSGGVQEETTILGVPCLTLRLNTERPITITHGTNRLVGTSTDGILAGYREAMAGPDAGPGRTPPLWDGHAAERIVAVVRERLPETIRKRAGG